jgi:hypothetical protein
MKGSTKSSKKWMSPSNVETRSVVLVMCSYNGKFLGSAVIHDAGFGFSSVWKGRQ